MKVTALYLLFIFSIVALYGFAFSVNTGEAIDGKKVFTDNKCSACHSFEAEGITKKLQNLKNPPPDLSKASGNLTQAKFVEYMKKKAEINEKKHPVLFKGSDEELNALGKWILSAKKTSGGKTKKTEPVK